MEKNDERQSQTRDRRQTAVSTLGRAQLRRRWQRRMKFALNVLDSLVPVPAGLSIQG
jgi:hypothetical protein